MRTNEPIRGQSIRGLHRQFTLNVTEIGISLLEINLYRNGLTAVSHLREMRNEKRLKNYRPRHTESILTD